MESLLSALKSTFFLQMIPIPRKHLPENRPKVLSPEELAERREAARQRLAIKKGTTLTKSHFALLPTLRRSLGS